MQMKSKGIASLMLNTRFLVLASKGKNIAKTQSSEVLNLTSRSIARRNSTVIPRIRTVWVKTAPSKKLADLRSGHYGSEAVTTQ